MNSHFCKTIAFLLASCCSLSSFSQTIDSLRTDDQVQSFVRGLRGGYGRVLFIHPPKPVHGLSDYVSYIKSFGARSYEKADFDHNGFTDLLINGYRDDASTNATCIEYSFAVLAFGKDSFGVKELTPRTYPDFFTTRIVFADGQPLISVVKVDGKYDSSLRRNVPDITHLDTLMYLYDDFIERSKPNNHVIHGIYYCVWGGMMGPPFQLWLSDTVFLMNIGASLSERKFNAIDSGGYFRMKADAHTYRKLLTLLKYIDLSKLKDIYAIDATDNPESTLKIHYDNGKIKKVIDYGQIGTHGLAALHSILMDMRDSLHWERIRAIDKDPFIDCSSD